MTNTQKRVLVAEDDTTQAMVLRAHLERAGLDVAVAGDGADALAIMRDRSFDLVVSDVMMPDVDGYELCRQVKDRYPSVPVVLLTSMSDPLDVVNALSAGADNFLRKPYEPEDLVHRIRNMLHNKEVRESGRPEMGLELFFLGRRFMINADREQVLDLLVSTFEDLVDVNHRLRAGEDELARAHDELATRLGEAELERDRLGAVLAAMPGGVAVFDTDGRLINANQQLSDMVHVPLPVLQDSVVWDVIQFVNHAGDPVPQEERALSETLCEGYGATRGTAFDLFVQDPQGRRLPVLARSEPIRDGSGRVIGAVGTLEDLRTLMNHDPVTGFAGHGILVDRLAAAAEASREHGTTTGLVVVTLDRWARIRESLAGKENQVIAVIANSLRTALRSAEIEQRSSTASAAYLGNGELVVVLPDIDGEAEALLIGHLLSERLSGSVEIDGTAITWTLSAAVGTCDGAADVAELVASVAASAQRASSEGGDRVVASDETLHAHVVDQLTRENELRTAITTDQLVVHYHPLVNIRDGHPVAVEALVRWQHPDRGLLGADEVVPLAIESGLICSVGWHVLEAACRHSAQWHKDLADAHRPSLSVNLAAEQLAEADVAGRIAAIVSDTGFDPTALVLEITEGSVMADPDTARERLAAIKALGVRMAIDDFGTGYSSLLQLRRLPIDVLKIDRTFVAGMLNEPADAAIVTSVVRLAHSLGLEVVAEGIENADQLVQLRVLGCDLGQGYHWAKPMPGNELNSWWSAQSTNPRFDDFADAGSADTDDQQDEAISYLVHELRSPLVAITGFAQLLQASSGHEPPPDFVDAIVRNAHELESRLSSLREANDVLRGGLTVRPEDNDVTELVQLLVHDLSPGLTPHSVDVTSSGPVVASVDPVRLGQAVGNLITNAAKFTPPETTIEVAVTATDAVGEIAVRDYGPGVPEHRQPELFRRFSRLGVGGKGMGLGLYLSRLIVEAHGGVLRYDDAPGGGAVFSIRLPRRSTARRNQSPEPDLTSAGNGGRDPVGGHDLSNSERAGAEPSTVLCVEDDVSTAELVKHIFDQHPAVTLVMAHDGVHGLHLALEQRADLVLLDLNVGGISGEEILETLRSRPETAEVPVMILTADADEQTTNRLLATGATAIVAKPFHPERLRQIVEGVLTSAHSPTTPRPEGRDVSQHEPLDPAMVAALKDLDTHSEPGNGVDRLVRRAITDAHAHLRSIKAAASKRDTHEMITHAHALRGALANLGAHVVAQRCHDIETAARTGDMATVPAALTRATAALAEATHALHSHFPSDDQHR